MEIAHFKKHLIWMKLELKMCEIQEVAAVIEMTVATEPRLPQALDDKRRYTSWCRR